MEKSYAELIKEKSNYQSHRSEKYKVDSKDRLSKIMRKKIETTMIGALSTIEDSFGFLWGKGQEEPLTNEQEIMKELYQSVRSEILDRGNNQARNIDAELGQYEVEWKKYSMTIPVMSKDN
jgi:hypothetical protein